MRLSLLVAFLMFVTSRASAGKRPSDVPRMLLCIVLFAHQTTGSARERCARSVRCPGTGVTGGGDGGPRVGSATFVCAYTAPVWGVAVGYAADNGTGKFSRAEQWGRNGMCHSKL